VVGAREKRAQDRLFDGALCDASMLQEVRFAPEKHSGATTRTEQGHQVREKAVAVNHERIELAGGHGGQYLWVDEARKGERGPWSDVPQEPVGETLQERHVVLNDLPELPVEARACAVVVAEEGRQPHARLSGQQAEKGRLVLDGVAGQDGDAHVG
jgi:hypothetical protein